MIIYLLTLHSASQCFLWHTVNYVSVPSVFWFLTYFLNLGHLKEQYCYAAFIRIPQFLTDSRVCVRVHVCKCRWPCLLM